MCGICGITGARDLDRVHAMNEAMRHRGPDDAGSYLDAETGMALGARRLSIIDVQHGHQPVANEDATVWAVLNGEIYNHPELQEWLRRRGHTLSSRTDTEVLVHLYEEFGDELVHSLEGMFAFAIWDQARKTLLVARDRFGEKPLFYAEHAPGGIVFASELSALLASGVVSDALSPEAVDLFFVHGYVPGPGSIFTDARQLPPGHRLRWTASSEVQIDTYWAPPENAPVDQPFSRLVAETRQLLERSVLSRMISDVPLGVFLSGGVDSSLIAALAAAHASGPIKTFTVGYDVGDVNETEPARTMAKQLGAQHHEVVLTQAEAVARAKAVLASVDQPLADPALVALATVAELARGEVTVTSAERARTSSSGATRDIAGWSGPVRIGGRGPEADWRRPHRGFSGTPPVPMCASGAGRPSSGQRTTISRHLSWVTADRAAY